MEVFIDWGERDPFLTFSMFKVICQPKCWKQLPKISLITVSQIFAIFRHCVWTRFLWEQHLHPWLVHRLPYIFWTPAARCYIYSIFEGPLCLVKSLSPIYQVRGLQDLTARLRTLTPLSASRSLIYHYDILDDFSLFTTMVLDPIITTIAW